MSLVADTAGYALGNGASAGAAVHRRTGRGVVERGPGVVGYQIRNAAFDRRPLRPVRRTRDIVDLLNGDKHRVKRHLLGGQPRRQTRDVRVTCHAPDLLGQGVQVWNLGAVVLIPIVERALTEAVPAGVAKVSALAAAFRIAQSDFGRQACILHDESVAPGLVNRSGQEHRVVRSAEGVDREMGRVDLGQRLVGRLEGRVTADIARDGQMRIGRDCRQLQRHHRVVGLERHPERPNLVDYADAERLLTEYRALILGMGYSYSFLQEIRVTKADPFWASPSYGRDSLWLSHHNMDRDDRWMAQRTRFEEWARANGGRPHWGKEATWDPEYLRAQYPRLDEFVELMTRYGPDGKFRND